MGVHKAAIGNLRELLVGGLGVCIPNRLALAHLDGLHIERHLLRQVIGDGRSDGDVDGLDVDIVLEDNDARSEAPCLVECTVEGLLVVDGRHLATMYTPVVGIALVIDALEGGVGERSPHDRCEVHGFSDCTDTVVDVTVRWPEEERSDPGDILDRLASPSELGDDLLISQGSERRMGPGVDP